MTKIVYTLTLLVLTVTSAAGDAGGILEDLLHLKEDIISGLLSPFTKGGLAPEENCGCPCRHFYVTHCEKSFVEDCQVDYYHKETCTSVPVYRPVRTRVTECQKCFRYNERVAVTRWVKECNPVYDEQCRTRYQRRCSTSNRCITLYQTVCQNEHYAQHCKNEPRQHCYPETKCSKTPKTHCVPVKKEHCAKVPREVIESQPRSSCMPFEAPAIQQTDVDCQQQNSLISGPLVTQTDGVRPAIQLVNNGGNINNNGYGNINNGVNIGNGYGNVANNGYGYDIGTGTGVGNINNGYGNVANNGVNNGYGTGTGIGVGNIINGVNNGYGTGGTGVGTNGYGQSNNNNNFGNNFGNNNNFGTDNLNTLNNDYKSNPFIVGTSEGQDYSGPIRRDVDDNSAPGGPLFPSLVETNDAYDTKQGLFPKLDTGDTIGFDDNNNDNNDNNYDDQYDESYDENNNDDYNNNVLEAKDNEEYEYDAYNEENEYSDPPTEPTGPTGPALDTSSAGTGLAVDPTAHLYPALGASAPHARPGPPYALSAPDLAQPTTAEDNIKQSVFSPRETETDLPGLGLRHLLPKTSPTPTWSRPTWTSTTTTTTTSARSATGTTSASGKEQVLVSEDGWRPLL